MLKQIKGLTFIEMVIIGILLGVVISFLWNLKLYLSGDIVAIIKPHYSEETIQIRSCRSYRDVLEYTTVHGYTGDIYHGEYTIKYVGNRGCE